MEIINTKNFEKENLNEEVGGDIACFMGCAGSCLIFAGAVSALGAVTSFI
ncbi:MAG: hypothetical protein K5986_03435 [Clostridium sp.]|nr:hypothetical protein [Clostridium sp.]